MSEKINFIINYDEDIDSYIKSNYPHVFDYRIISLSLDARGAPRGKVPKYHAIIDAIKPGEDFNPHRESFPHLGAFKNPPIIIGAGPCGLFSALRFADYGIPVYLFERGDRAQNRMIHIAKFWRYGAFDPENNVCYGEGGAGLFSDGKLITRVKSPYVQYVMNRFVDFGAPKETAYQSNPHLGSNKIRGLISKMTSYIESVGSKVFYNARVDRLLFSEDETRVIGVELSTGEKYFSDYVILAVGHSAKEMFYHLHEKKVAMSQKDFAVGVRIEHPRRLIDKLQLGEFCGPILGSARYRLSYENPSSHKGTYSFCMCPGGYVLSSGTDADGIVVNGMSNYKRNSPWSNAALVVSVQKEKDFSSVHVLEGLKFIENIEKKAFQLSMEKASGKEIPAQRLKDFLDQKKSDLSLTKTSTPSGIFSQDLDSLLPKFIVGHLTDALLKFDEQMKGFISNEALLLAPETRTSSPVSIMRDKYSLQSLSHLGLYPCGEGAGHAGGITSAAVDGVKVAMSIIAQEKNYKDQYGQ